VSNWFKLEKDREAKTAKRLLTDLFHNSNIASLELARTPLLLTFLCLTFDDSQRFPRNRALLYRNALLILLQKWAAEKRIHAEDTYKDLHPDLEIEMLSEIAHHFFQQDKIFFYTDDIKKTINDFITKNYNVAAIDANKILEAIEIQQGLLMQRALQIYSFSHLTIQEYLTANYYYSRPFEIETFVSRNVFSVRWREVFLLLAGLSKADTLLLSMMESIENQLKGNSIVKKSIQWVNTVIAETDDYENDCCRRIVCVSLLLRYKRYDSHGLIWETRIETAAIRLLHSVNKHFAKSFGLQETLNKKDGSKILDILANWRGNHAEYKAYQSQINSLVPSLPMHKMLMGARHGFRRKIVKVMYQALKVPEHLGDLKKKDYTALISYLDALALIAECRNSALLLSKQIWKTVCLRILR
jgi:hypothetical protein